MPELKFANTRFRDFTPQELIDREAESRRRKSIDELGAGIGEYARARKEEAGTKRQQAMQVLDATSKLRNQGYDVSPEQVKQLIQEPAEGPSMARRATDALGITEAEAAVAPPNLADIFSKRTPEYMEKKKRQEQDDQLRTMQIEEAQRKSAEAGIPFGESREYKKIEAKQKLSEKTKPISESRRKAATFAERVGQSEDVFKDLESKGYSRADVTSGLESMLPTTFQSTESQQQEQAERNFINAILRRESGAAIAPSEFDSAEKQYFPRAGDSPETKVQKARNRDIALKGMRAEAGDRAIADIQGSLEPQQPVQQEAQPQGGIFNNEAVAAPPMKPIQAMSREEKLKELMGN